MEEDPGNGAQVAPPSEEFAMVVVVEKLATRTITDGLAPAWSTLATDCKVRVSGGRSLYKRSIAYPGPDRV